MNCKWAEGYLSACLDGTLDPDVRDEVVAHIEGCTHCSSILEDYRHFDGLVAHLPRYEPPAELRARIFDSPEFAEIVRSLDSSEDESAGRRHPAAVRPFLISRPARRDRHDRSLTPLPLPQDVGQPPASAAPPTTAGQSAGDDAGAQANRAGQHAPTLPMRMALVAAAILVVAVGAGIALLGGLFHGTARTGGISNVGGFQGTPLTAGPRAVYERGGSLWSLPERSNGVAQQLTPNDVLVGAGWAVAPVRAGGAGGDLVAYIDLKTGTLHIVRSDDQKDHVVGQALVPAANRTAAFWASTEGQALLSGLAWSPDGTRLAYLADAHGTGQTSLMVARADGSGAAVAVPLAVGGSSAHAVWSADGSLIAFVQTAGTSQAIWTYDTATQQTSPVGAVSDVAGASVLVLGWLPAAATPTITWASGDAASGTISGVWSAAAQQSGSAQQLSPAGQSFSAAAYAPAAAGGMWLLGDSTAVYTLAAQGGSLTPLASVAGGVSAVAWSPDGSIASFLSTGGNLSVWAPTGAVSKVASGVAAQPAMAWSADGSALAFVSGGQLNIVRLNAGTVGVPVAVAGLSNPTTLIWAPDGRQVAVTTAAGVALVGVDGTSMHLLDPRSAAGQVAWSVAR